MEAAGWAVEAAAAAAVAEVRRRSIGVGGAELVAGVGRWRRRGLGGRRGRRCMGRSVGVVGRGSNSMLQAPEDRRRCAVGGGPFVVGGGREYPG